MEGLLSAAISEGRAKELPMGDVEFQSFRENITGYGTQNLRSCVVAMIASRHGVVMGHFPAFGAAWVHDTMDKFFDLFRQNRATCFPLLSEV